VRPAQTIEDHSPTHVRIGKATARKRRLNDAEIFAFWRATGRMKYPLGSLYRILLLTGLRLNEAARLSSPELHGDYILIPAERMKGQNDEAREHLVPLSTTAQEIIASLRRYRGAPFLLSFRADSTDSYSLVFSGSPAAQYSAGSDRR
jgi:integrase